jgi:hypothetical protein
VRLYLKNTQHKKGWWARHWWLTPVILATQEAEIRRIMVGSQPGQIVLETLLKKKRVGRVAQGVGPVFKFQYCKKKKKQNKTKGKWLKC